jgi:hypothetical protein
MRKRISRQFAEEEEFNVMGEIVLIRYRRDFVKIIRLHRERGNKVQDDRISICYTGHC